MEKVWKQIYEEKIENGYHGKIVSFSTYSESDVFVHIDEHGVSTIYQSWESSGSDDISSIFLDTSGVEKLYKILKEHFNE